jgi:hypothetical protein
VAHPDADWKHDVADKPLDDSQMERSGDPTFSFRSRAWNTAPGGAVIEILALRPFRLM